MNLAIITAKINAANLSRRKNPFKPYEKRKPKGGKWSFIKFIKE